MKDSRLADLNFREIVDYGGQPPIQNEYASPLNCHGYCVSCEEAGLLAKAGGRLDLMSHGCDSADYETILGPVPREGVPVHRPVLFLLQDPGADYGNGAPRDFRGFRKQPPVNHYYWTPNVQVWPTRVVDFGGNFYGPYFAYLMRRHQLLNVYVTNVVKCKWVKDSPTGNGDASAILSHCVARYLVRELTLFGPDVALCFGRDTERNMRALVDRTGRRCIVQYLRHPAFIQFRHQTVRQSQEKLVQENDDRIAGALAKLV